MLGTKIIRQFTLDADVWDADLPQKINATMASRPIVSDPRFFYAFDLVFDYRAFASPKFFKVKLDKPLPERKYTKRCNVEAEQRRDLIGAILSQLLGKVSSAMCESKLDICHTAIIGDERSNPRTVEFFLYEDKEKEYDKKGRLVNAFKVSSIMPNRPETLNRAARILADIFLKQYREGLFEETEISAHTPNLVRADIVFKRVAEAALLDIRMGKEKRTEAISLLSNTLRLHASVKSGWPLEVSGQGHGKTLTEPMAPDYEIDCPKYLLYHEFKSGAWILKSISGFSEAQYMVTRNNGYNHKDTACIAVLQDLKPIKFSLFAETNSGLVPVKKAEASNHKNLNLCWERI